MTDKSNKRNKERSSDCSPKNNFIKGHVTTSGSFHAVILGRRAEGKVKLIKDILCFHNQKAEDGFYKEQDATERYTLIFNGTENFTGTYSKDPSISKRTIVHSDYSADILKKCLQDKDKPTDMVVFDNCFYSVSIRDKILDDLLHCAAKRGISTVFCADNPVSLPPVARLTCTILVLFKDNIYLNHKRIYTMFAKKNFNTFTDFETTYRNSTEPPFSCLVMNLQTKQCFAGLQRCASSHSSMHSEMSLD